MTEPSPAPDTDPPPWTLSLGDRRWPFANLAHPDWKPFFDRMERRHGSFKRLTFGELMDQPDVPLSSQAEEYLKWTSAGRLALYVEGLCLADPSLERAATERFFALLSDSDLASIIIGPG
jgi:hypothetical protein